MRVVRHSTPQSFQQQAVPFLLQREATHNLILGVVSRFNEGFPENAYFAHVENEKGDVVAAAMLTPPNGAVLSAVTDMAAIPALVEDYAAVYDKLPSALGAIEDTKAFVELWHERTRQPYHLHMQQGIYQLTKVNPVKNVSGDYRVATVNERELMLDWALDFAFEALGEKLDRDEYGKLIDRKLENNLTNCLRLWWDEGQPVAMITSTRPTPNGVTVTMVYTPPDLRGRGYASALTAAISQELLDSGKKLCFLYTDMSNPTSNKIYQNIGYELVCHQHFYHFSDPV
jgi:predicted GNAT family acetyltransferase